MADFEERFWREFQRMSSRMDEWMGEHGAGPSLAGPLAFSPAADVCETDSAYLVRVEIAGVDPEALRVVLEGHTLFIWGERRAQRAEGGRVHQMEIAFGPFQKSVQLPGSADPEKVTTSYDRGMLLMEIAKPQTRRIQVRTENP